MTKFFIDHHGCAKNQADGEIIVGHLVKNGFSLTLNAAEADFIIVNSCGFIESAKKESIDAVCNIHRAYPNAKIILTGCLAQRYASELFENMSELSGVFGNGDLSKISDFMKSVSNEKRTKQVFEQTGVCSGERPYLFNFPGSAYVKITEGCSHHCSFCAIPLIRGECRSRPLQEILEEIKGLVKDGVYEINLIGQDLAAYGTEENADIFANATEDLKKSKVPLSPASAPNSFGISPLAFLLQKISELKGDFLIRLLYIHPDFFNSDILDVMQKDSRFAHYFDIPFQSGDDDIILAMNRSGSSSSYESLVQTIRQKLPDAVLRTTFLAGFPGETEKNSQNTLSFMKKIKPDWSGAFSYSREEDTPAFFMKHRVSSKTSEKRVSLLQETQQKITEEKLTSYVGKEFSVLLEEDFGEGIVLGRAWFQAPDVDGNVVVRYDQDDEEQKQAAKPGNIVKVRIIASTGVDLDSKFVSLISKSKNNSSRNFVF